MAEDKTNPSHYQQEGKIQPIEYIESWDFNFNLGNVIKYVTRAPYKGEAIVDLEKARWYINREIEKAKRLSSKAI